MMVFSGLQWIWIKNIKSDGRQLTDARGRGRTKGIRTVKDAGKGGSYDAAHAVMGCAINWFKH